MDVQWVRGLFQEWQKKMVDFYEMVLLHGKARKVQSLCLYEFRVCPSHDVHHVPLVW